MNKINIKKYKYSFNNSLYFNLFCFFSIKNRLKNKRSNIYYFSKKKYVVLSLKKPYIFFNDKILFFKTKIYFKCFLSLLKTLVFKLSFGSFFELKLKGVGYNVYIKKNFLFFELGFSHYIALQIPKNIIIKRFKARLAIFSFYNVILHNFVKKIISLKKLDSYKGKGIIYKDQKLVLKEGKKR